MVIDWRLWRPKAKPTVRKTAAQKAERLRRGLRRNPSTGELLITRRYKDAVIDEIIGSDPERLLEEK